MTNSRQIQYIAFIANEAKTYSTKALIIAVLCLSYKRFVILHEATQNTKYKTKIHSIKSSPII